MSFDMLDDWVDLYRQAGLDEVQVDSGPFAMMTPAGFLQDERIMNSLRILGRAFSRGVYLRKMAWLMPRLQRVVPYLGYVTISGVKPEPA